MQFNLTQHEPSFPSLQLKTLRFSEVVHEKVKNLDVQI